MATSLTVSPKPIHPTKLMDMPYQKVGSEGAWKGTFSINRNNFKDFASSNAGGRNTMIASSDDGPDFQQVQYFNDNKFINVDQDSLAWAYDPSPGWANIADCGNFPCTGPKNILWYFKNTYWEGQNTYLNPPLGSDF
jgi:hypothetical protein